jgi:hypothetical protein
MAYREEVPAKLELTCSPSLCEDECSELPTCVHEPEAEDVVEAETLVGAFTLTDGEGNVLAQATNKIRTLGVNDTITVNPTVSVDGGEPVKLGPKLKVHKPEPTPPPATHAIFEDIEFDDALVAKMMANIAANGMTLADLGG